MDCILLTAFVVRYIDCKNTHSVSYTKFVIVQFVPIYYTKFSFSRFHVLSHESEEIALEYDTD